MGKKPDKDDTRPTTKSEQAEVRRLLFEKLGPIEQDARTVLATINKLRHGDLDQLSQLAAAGEQAKTIGKNLRKVNDAILGDSSPSA